VTHLNNNKKKLVKNGSKNKEKFLQKEKLRWPFIFSSKFFQAKDGVIENNHHLEEEKKFLKK